MADWFSIMDRYGIPGTMLSGVGFAAFYVLRRLFAKDDGILTRVGNRHIEYLDEQEKIGQSLARSNERLTTTAEAGQKTLDRLAELHDDPESTFATVHLNRSGLHACDVVEAVARNLGISDETKASIESIRRELGGIA